MFEIKVDHNRYAMVSIFAQSYTDYGVKRYLTESMYMFRGFITDKFYQYIYVGESVKIYRKCFCSVEYT